MRINEEAACSKPRAELIYLQDIGKIYLPRATLLHRCSDLTGCCPHATHSCQATQVETVSLYFFTINVQARYRQNQNIEKISFVNHTDCSCMPLPVDNGRSESLRKNESLFLSERTAPRVNTASSEHSLEEFNNSAEGGGLSADDPRSAMYNGDLYNGAEGAEGNQIEINNGRDSSNNVLKNWGQLLGMYKTKVYKGDYGTGSTDSSDETVRRQSKFSAGEQRTAPTAAAAKRMDLMPSMMRIPRPAAAPLPSSTPFVSAYHLLPAYQHPSQSFMYYYPTPASQHSSFSVGSSRLTSSLVNRAPLETGGNYQLAYRRVH